MADVNMVAHVESITMAGRWVLDQYVEDHAEIGFSDKHSDMSGSIAMPLDAAQQFRVRDEINIQVSILGRKVT